MKRILFCLLFVGITDGISSQSGQPEYHQFDFWIGKWNVYKNGTDTIVGFSNIESILDSFAIRETYSAKKGGYKGASLNKFNSQNGKWEQFWVDNGGFTLFLKGTFKENRMVLEGETISQDVLGDKQVVRERITWTKNKDGTVRQLWEQQKPGQEKWFVVFDGLYKKTQ